jgi:hypothetical protein
MMGAGNIEFNQQSKHIRQASGLIQLFILAELILEFHFPFLVEFYVLHASHIHVLKRFPWTAV